MKVPPPVFTRHYGPGASVAGTERFFALYTAVGPALWRAIEQERAQRGPPGGFPLPSR